VKFILTLGPGAAQTSRPALSGPAQPALGQPVVVENRPGDGIVAIQRLVSASRRPCAAVRADSSFTAHPFLHDTCLISQTSLVPIARCLTIVRRFPCGRLDVGDLAQLIALARAKPDKLNWAGTTGALSFMFGLAEAGRADITKVAYKNPVDAASDLAEVGCRCTSRRCNRPPAAAIRQNKTSCRDHQPCVHRASRTYRRRRSRLSRADVRRPSRLFGPRTCARSAAAHHRRHPRRRRRHHRGTPRRHRPTPQCRRSGGIRHMVDEQRAEVAKFAKIIGMNPLPQN